MYQRSPEHSAPGGVVSIVVNRESDVQRAIKEYAHLLGFHVSDFSQGYRSGGKRHGTTRITKGVPDLYLAHAEKHFRCWVEVKRKGGKPTQAQREWHRVVSGAGAKVWVCDSVETFAAYLESYGFPGLAA